MSDRELDECIAELRIQLTAMQAHLDDLQARLDGLQAKRVKVAADWDEAITRRYVEGDFGEGR